MTRLPIGTAWEKYWAAPEGDSERRGTTSDAGARRAGGTGVPMSLQSPAESPILHPGAANNRQMMEYAPCLTQKDRKSVVEGKSVSVRVDPGGRGSSKQK